MTPSGRMTACPSDAAAYGLASGLRCVYCSARRIRRVRHAHHLCLCPAPISLLCFCAAQVPPLVRRQDPLHLPTLDVPGRRPQRDMHPAVRASRTVMLQAYSEPILPASTPIAARPRGKLAPSSPRFQPADTPSLPPDTRQSPVRATPLDLGLVSAPSTHVSHVVGQAASTSTAASPAGLARPQPACAAIHVLLFNHVMDLVLAPQWQSEPAQPDAPPNDGLHSTGAMPLVAVPARSAAAVVLADAKEAAEAEAFATVAVAVDSADPSAGLVTATACATVVAEARAMAAGYVLPHRLPKIGHGAAQLNHSSQRLLSRPRVVAATVQNVHVHELTTRADVHLKPLTPSARPGRSPLLARARPDVAGFPELRQAHSQRLMQRVTKLTADASARQGREPSPAAREAGQEHGDPLPSGWAADAWTLSEAFAIGSRPVRVSSADLDTHMLTVVRMTDSGYGLCVTALPSRTVCRQHCSDALREQRALAVPFAALREFIESASLVSKLDRRRELCAWVHQHIVLQVSARFRPPGGCSLTRRRRTLCTGSRCLLSCWQMCVPDVPSDACRCCHRSRRPPASCCVPQWCQRPQVSSWSAFPPRTPPRRFSMSPASRFPPQGRVLRLRQTAP